MRILVERVCEKHYVAHLEGRPEISGSGESCAEAVGELICVHYQRFDIEVQSYDPAALEESESDCDDDDFDGDDDYFDEVSQADIDAATGKAELAPLPHPGAVIDPDGDSEGDWLHPTR